MMVRFKRSKCSKNCIQVLQGNGYRQREKVFCNLQFYQAVLYQIAIALGRAGVGGTLSVYC